MSNGYYFYLNGVACSYDLTSADGSEAYGESVSLESGVSAEVIIKCPWASRFKLIRGLMGGVTLNGTYMTFLKPAMLPDYPKALCTGIGGIKGLLPATRRDGWPTYKFALVTAQFTVPPWIQDESYPPFTTLNITTAPEVFTPPGGAFYMPALSGAPVAENSLGIIRAHSEVTITREFIPYPPVAACMKLAGTINSDDITISDRTFPRGCLMFVGMGEATPMADPMTGYQAYKVSYKFMGNDDTEFNKFLGRDGEYHTVNSQKDGSGRAPFEYASHSWFFGNDLASP
ncbi:hypothetical protein [Singulisphaera sp. PoT]|uniref:hypothetical protein n=1 Tax=Singulisphaera sp. PoT TaxID=3411797 RepID=UPI003BF583F0